jgi:hypothetical protein
MDDPADQNKGDDENHPDKKEEFGVAPNGDLEPGKKSLGGVLPT